jgi:hypothetical protein
MKLKAQHPALSEARTIHPKQVKPVTDDSVLLKPVAANGKMGKGLSVIMRGKWRGFPLYALTLQERATCPSTCMRWAECFGNGMMFAHRFEAGDALERKLEREVMVLAAMHPAGFAIRLHVLGDFYSVEYVELWSSLLRKYPNLNIYGYTARRDGAIADAIRAVRITMGERFWIRISANGQHDGGSDIFAAQEGNGGIVCPEQTGKTESCLTCGLCWSTTRTIEFIDHDKLNKARKEVAR